MDLNSSSSRPATPHQVLYAEKAQPFLIATGLSLVIIGTILLMVVAANCEYQTMNLMNIGWMAFCGVVGIVTGFCVARKSCVDECWNSAPITFQAVLLSGFFVTMSVAVGIDHFDPESSCTIDLSSRRICRLNVCPSQYSCSPEKNSTFFCTDCVTSVCRCCQTETAAFLTIVYGLITVINAAHLAKFLYFKTWKRWAEEAFRDRLWPISWLHSSSPVSLPANLPIIVRPAIDQPPITRTAKVNVRETSYPLETVVRAPNLGPIELIGSASYVRETDRDCHQPMLYENPRNFDLPPSYESPPSYEEIHIL